MILKNTSRRVMFFKDVRVDPNQEVKLDKKVWSKSKNIEGMVAKGEAVILGTSSK